jgi:hypothetical protein
MSINGMNLKSRLRLALLGMAGVMTVYAVGILDNPWIDLFSMPDGGIVARPKIFLILMAPVLAYAVAPRVQLLRHVLILVTICCFAASSLDLLLRVPKPKNASEYLYPHWLPSLPIIWRFEPNLDIRSSAIGDLALRSDDPTVQDLQAMVFQTDAWGFRNNHGREGIDLLVLGDSFGAGAGTTQDRTFATLLETQSGRRVYNLSVPGSPHDEYLNFLVEYSNITFSPNAHLVWELSMGNDLEDYYRDVWDLERLPWQTRLQAWITRYKNFRQRSPLRRRLVKLHRRVFGDERGQVVIRRKLPNGRPLLFNRFYDENVTLSKTEVEQHPNFPKLERTMIEMRNRAGERGIKMTILLIPAKEEVYRWLLAEREPRPEDTKPSGFALAVLDACGRAHIRCLDTGPDLRKEAYRLFDSSGELVYGTDDSHLGDRGHEIIAALIAREILHDTH